METKENGEWKNEIPEEQRMEEKANSFIQNRAEKAGTGEKPRETYVLRHPPLDAAAPDRSPAAHVLHPEPKRTVKTNRAQARGKDTGEGKILFVQVILCALITVFVLIVHSGDTPFHDVLCREYEWMLTRGIEFPAENRFARFASAAAERLSQQPWIRNSARGTGGSWPVTDDKNAPEGATFENPSLSVRLLLPVSGCVTSGYGFRVHPVSGKKDFHAGTDIAVPEGTAVLAADSGLVTSAGYNRLRGSYVVIRHAHGIETLYQHLSFSFVRGGETVRRGQRIALTGSTGFVTGPHLHLEVRKDGICFDPAFVFPELVP